MQREVYQIFLTMQDHDHFVCLQHAASAQKFTKFSCQQVKRQLTLRGTQARHLRNQLAEAQKLLIDGQLLLMLLAGATALMMAQALIASKINHMQGAYLLLACVIQYNANKKVRTVWQWPHVTMLV